MYHGTKPADNPTVDIGDDVLDVGSPLAQHLRSIGYAAPAVRCGVIGVFAWGLRVTDGFDEWNCEHWILPENDE